MHSTPLILTAVLLASQLAFALEMSKAERPDAVGYTCVGSRYFPSPPGVQQLDVPNGSFEDALDSKTQAWHVYGLKRVERGAPHGKACLQAPAGAKLLLHNTNLPIRGDSPHLLSFWLKSENVLTARITSNDGLCRFGRGMARSVPATGGEWKRIGLYFRLPEGTTRASFLIRLPQQEGRGPIAIDGVRLRTATEDEMAAAFRGWRAKFPARDLSPRPTDGQNLALSIRKLEGGLNRPFRIWALGSSYTNMLGDGETLRQMIRSRFPNAPRIIYKKHVGASVTFKYVYGWVDHVALPDQPDLILIYTIGRPDNFEKLITHIRRQCTADIIVPTIHWRMRGKKLWGKPGYPAPDIDVPAMRAICQKHGVEFVESRREWAEFMNAHGMQIEIDRKKLLKDAVHQSDYGALIINENIGRHFAKPAKFNYNPDTRERRLAAVGAKSIHTNERVEFDGSWRVAGKCLRTSQKGARTRVTFQGNRIDMVGAASPNGGTAQVFVDGKPGDQAPAFFTTFIEPNRKNYRAGRGLLSDYAPHYAQLGENVAPQKWTITMISDTGDYRLAGTVTGFDGAGNNQKPFTSQSGQIRIDPELWRHSKDRKGNFSNRTGDTFSFEVVRAAVGEVSFKGKPGAPVERKLVQNLPKGEHVLELVADGDGEIAIEAFDVFEPPE